MKHRTFSQSKRDQRLRPKPRTPKAVAPAAALLMVLTVPFILCAQERSHDEATNASELATRNLSRVAASATDIKAVLATDAGLMVELKKLFAKDASDHGQIVSDSDLTDGAMYERLERDVRFRSAATALLQKYGYLVPKLNPESELAKEQELLIQERTKWMAQHEEEQRAQERQSAALQTYPSACAATAERDPAATVACNTPTAGPGSAAQAPAQEGSGPARLRNKGSNQDGRDEDTGSVKSEQILRTANEDSNYAGGSGYSAADSQLMLAGAVMSGSSPLLPQTAGKIADQHSTGFTPATNFPASEATDGLLSAYGIANRIDLTPASAGIENQIAGGNPDFVTSRTPTPIEPGARSTTQRPTLTYGLPPQPELMTRRPMPYRNVPSLYDMYVQAVAHPVTPGRFGKEVFENGIRDPQLIPMDLPVGPDYVIGPGDGLSVDLWGSISQRLYRVVDREGRISLPELGPVLVSGKSLSTAQQDLQQSLKTAFRDASADISLARLRTIRVYEVGDVSNPGAYDISSLSTPLNALFSAGGPTPRGSMRLLKHYRGSQLVQTVDLYDLLLHGVKTDLKRLENGDTIQVPPIGPQVTIEGMVRRPAIYELRDEQSLAAVLDLAGGLLPVATLRHIEVQRLIAHQTQTMLNLDIPDTDSSTQITRKLEAFQILDGDRIRIYPIAPYNQDVVYLDGHAIRPGRYSYHASMKVTDLISSFKDLLPEPATGYAEIIHLNAPDFHPTVESFDLAAAFNNPDQAPALRPMDTVRIFSRFDFEDVPTVSVLGDVRAPGTYDAPGQIHLSDAVHLAGGLSPDAQTVDAQVFRYLPDSKVKIFSVNLGLALAGDPTENIFLQPRDRLLIHRNADAVDPASVFIQGEVAKPGRYPLTTNMRVADLIHVGGGLAPSADTKTADLTKFQWSDQTKLEGQQQVVSLAAAFAGDSNSNAILHNGDVLTIRQLPGWNDLGASISVKGEVKHPGAYGIRPGERLSSILERAGGFEPEAYPYGAVLQREQVRELEARAQDEMILRVKESQTELENLPTTDAQQKQAKEASLQQWRSTLQQLSSNPPVGRVSIRISSSIKAWKDTPADIEVRAGDTITVPKKPSYVMVTGQVFNATAVGYRPGKSAKWYLGQAGGPTAVANRKAIFVIRADGSVVGGKHELWSGDSLNVALRPGDTVVVPEKPYSGPIQWQNVFSAAQLASSVASTIFIALRY